MLFASLLFILAGCEGYLTSFMQPAISKLSKSVKQENYSKLGKWNNYPMFSEYRTGDRSFDGPVTIRRSENFQVSGSSRIYAYDNHVAIFDIFPNLSGSPNVKDIASVTCQGNASVIIINKALESKFIESEEVVKLELARENLAIIFIPFADDTPGFSRESYNLFLKDRQFSSPIFETQQVFVFAFWVQNVNEAPFDDSTLIAAIKDRLAEFSHNDVETCIGDYFISFLCSPKVAPYQWIMPNAPRSQHLAQIKIKDSLVMDCLGPGPMTLYGPLSDEVFRQVNGPHINMTFIHYKEAVSFKTESHDFTNTIPTKIKCTRNSSVLILRNDSAPLLISADQSGEWIPQLHDEVAIFISADSAMSFGKSELLILSKKYKVLNLEHIANSLYISTEQAKLAIFSFSIIKNEVDLSELGILDIGSFWDSGSVVVRSLGPLFEDSVNGLIRQYNYGGSVHSANFTVRKVEGRTLMKVTRAGLVSVMVTVDSTSVGGFIIDQSISELEWEIAAGQHVHIVFSASEEDPYLFGSEAFYYMLLNRIGKSQDIPGWIAQRYPEQSLLIHYFVIRGAARFKGETYWKMEENRSFANQHASIPDELTPIRDSKAYLPF